MPPARVTTPDGATIDTADPGFDDRLSALVGRPVRLASSAGDAPRIEGYWPDFEFVESPDAVFEVKLPPGTFFDAAVVHLLTTTTLETLRSVRPGSRFELPRFRPNIVVDARRRGRRLPGERLGRPHAPDRRRGAAGDLGALPALRHDDREPGRPAQGPGRPPDGRAAERGERRRAGLRHPGRTVRRGDAVVVE